MRRNMVAIIIGYFLLTQTLYSIEVAGIRFDESFFIKGVKLHLNGVGILRKSMFRIKIYANALYLAVPDTAPERIVAADKPMAVRMHILYRRISHNQLVKGLKNGFSYSLNHDVVKLRLLQSRIHRFLSFFVGKPHKYDTATFLYIPGEGTHVSINNSYQGCIPGLDFKRALFGIWLGANPADKQMKKDMLRYPSR